MVERLSDVGLTQYARKLSALGFDDVRQLLALQHSVDARDGTRLDLYESGYSSVLDQVSRDALARPLADARLPTPGPLRFGASSPHTCT